MDLEDAGLNPFAYPTLSLTATPMRWSFVSRTPKRQGVEALQRQPG